MGFPILVAVIRASGLRQWKVAQLILNQVRFM